MSDESTDNTCIVCFKNSKYFSVGECDHPVCYECSTRMRVLLQQKECPICRQVMPNVIFTENVRPFKDINHNDFNQDDSAKISFENADIMKAYYDLQRIKCPKCPSSEPCFLDFKALEAHVKSEHNHAYCDLCTEHLQIFPSERKCYSKSELALHNRLGDKNDRSHRGHNLCQFCNKRFFDNDLLYRHLRKEHLFCHFCDADGLNKFYSSYQYLREHFQKKHFLCEEGECRNEHLVNAFRTDLDLKAHKVSTHGKNLGKQAYKEARIVDLQLNFKPRPQSDNHGRRNHGISITSLSRSDAGAVSSSSSSMPVNGQGLVVADYSEFPSLSGSVSSTPPPVIKRRFPEKQYGRSNFSMAKEDFPSLAAEFPALGARPSTANPVPRTISTTSARPSTVNPVPRAISSALARPSPANPVPKTISSMSARSLSSADGGNPSNDSGVLQQWGSSRRNEQVQPVVEKPKPQKKSRSEDFPSLTPVNSSASISKSKKSGKQNSNENDAGHSSSQSNKIKVKKKNDFENYPEKSKAGISKKKQNYNETKSSDGTNKSTKTAKEPQLSSKTNKYSVNNNSGSKSDINNLNGNFNVGRSNVNNAKSNGNDSGRVSSGNKSNGTSINNCNNNNNTSNNSGSKKNKHVILNERNFPSLGPSQTDNHSSTNNQSIKKPKQKSSNSSGEPKNQKPAAPPGFEPQPRPKAVNPPPGFTSLNSNTDLLIDQNLSYTYPPNFEERNLSLERTCRNIFERNKKSFRDFKQESELFISGILSAESYLDSISGLLGNDQFHTIFPELIVLLPNIQKQQELFAAYEKLNNKLAKKLKKNECSMCGQVLSASDKGRHSSAHNLSFNFPPLGLSSMSKK